MYQCVGALCPNHAPRSALHASSPGNSEFYFYPAGGIRVNPLYNANAPALVSSERASASPGEKKGKARRHARTRPSNCGNSSRVKKSNPFAIAAMESKLRDDDLD